MDKTDIFILSGESSGDLHCSYLVKDILAHKPELKICGIGGAKMRNAGAEILYEYSEINYIGFVSIAEKYFYLKNKLKFTARKITELNPKILILCDFPGFNLRIAKSIRKSFKGKIYYYITPQVWAWHKSRVKDLKKYIDQCFVILPFEKDFLSKEGINSYFAGNPVLRQVKEFLATAQKEQTDNKIVSLMPGSRIEEISRILPILNDIGKLLAIKYDYEVNLICTNNIPKAIYSSRINNRYINLVYPEKDSNLKAIYNSDLVITKFGTSNLECAFLGVPFISVYKANFINYILAKALINIKHVSLANIVMNKEVVKEFIQSDFNINNVIKESERISNDEKYRNNMLSSFKSLEEVFEQNVFNLPEYICSHF